MYRVLCGAVLFVLSQIAVVQVNAANDGGAMVDPTRPLGFSAKQKVQSELKLQAIFYGNGRKEAIVSGISVKEGDRVHGKKIVRIKEDAVVYEKNGGRYTLVLRPSIYK